MMSKIYGIIYKATNKTNGKSYIGQTVKSLNKRMNNHISEALNEINSTYFHKAIKKYGKENFKWEIIVECNSLEELNDMEIEMIKKYNTFDDGYNLTEGGEGKIGCNHTEESKKKISDSIKGDNHPLYGKHHTKESKEKMSESRKGEKNYMYGKHRTEETKKKIGDANRDKLVGKKHPSARKYNVTTPTGEKIFVYGLRDFCRNYKKEKLCYQNLIKVARGKLKQHKKYECEYCEGGTNE